MLFTVCLARLKMFKASGVFVCLFGGIDVWTHSFALARLAPEPHFQPFCSGYLEDIRPRLAWAHFKFPTVVGITDTTTPSFLWLRWGLPNIFPGMAFNLNPLISASQVARIMGICHWHPVASASSWG
jgi:hypothetical protein